MSKGHGWVQNAVLKHLSSQPDGTTFESARWQLQADITQLSTRACRNLPNKWNTSVMRAVKGLQRENLVEVVRRPLISFSECVAHYPNKTLLGSVRQLRLHLLPALLRWIEDGHAVPRYNPADNEKFHLQSLTPDVRKMLRISWLRLEPKLINLLPPLDRADRNALFELVGKGKSIFEKQGFVYRRSFAECVGNCIEHRLLSEPLAGEVRALSDSMLSPIEASYLRMKSYIHTFAIVPPHGGCSLREDVVNYLDESCKEVVRSLPGYVPAAPQRAHHPHYAFREAGKAKHIPQLSCLFDQTVFQTFHFLRIA